MISKQLYAIRDIKTDSYDSPFDSVNQETAKRYFARVLQHVPLMSEHPEDFTLHYIGEYTPASAQLTPHGTIQYICSGLDCVKNTQEIDPNGKSQQSTKIGDDSSIQSST